MIIENCRGLKPRTLVRQFSIPKIARLNTPDFSPGISAIFVIKIQPDKQKAKSLIEMAETTLERLKEIKKEKYPSNTLTDYYDILRKLMEALNSLEGIKVKGEGAHSQIINYVCNRHKLGSSDQHFLQEMRDYRNRISYESFNVRERYIKDNSKRIERIISVLLKLTKKKVKP